ncbi:leucine-rich repeat-containing protein [Tanacetum coccineum]|uniref:Leucine-rich repeat-containing protein n=1 Tax=Tanacetum coccineum TaxID=301880 RepID=A0ABQ4ZM77_9ASTR
MTDTPYSISLNTPYRSVEYQYAVLSSQNTSYCLEEQIRRLDCKTHYAVLGRKFDTSYPTGGYGVSGNRFSGQILVELEGLRWMNLLGNLLTGRIPENIDKMTLLESLDLSVNQLDGSIPLSISRLSLLSSLNLSYNKLTGQIPMSTQLQSLNASSFIGNALYGPPLAASCDKKGVTPDVSTQRGGEEQTCNNSHFHILLRQ